MVGLSEAAFNISDPILPALLVVMGLAVGILTGLFGAGGGFLIVPALNILLGIPYPLAVGSSLCFTAGSGTTGLSRYARMGNVEPRILVIVGVWSILGAIGGAWLQRELEQRLAGTHGAFTLVMHGIFIAILLLTAVLMYLKSRFGKTGWVLMQRFAVRPTVLIPSLGGRISIPGLSAIGFIAGIFTGLLGIGGGVLFVPAFALLVGLETHQAVGTSLGVVVIASVAGVIIHGLAGNVSLTVAMVLLIGSSAGVQIGAWMSQKLTARRLQQGFVLLLVLVIAMLVADMMDKSG